MSLHYKKYSWFSRFGVGLRVCIFDELPGDAAAVYIPYFELQSFES